jgi:Protein of unknown function (DUF998)
MTKVSLMRPQGHDTDAAVRCCGIRRSRIATRQLDMLRPVRLLGSVGIATFVSAVLALHCLRPDLNAQVHTVSEYSIGDYGWLMRAAFVALGLGVLATSLSIDFAFGPSKRRRVGLLLLVGTALGLFLDAGYNTDHLRVPETTSGAVHGVGTLMIGLTLPAAALILGSEFTSISRSRARWLQVLAVAQVGAIFVFETGPIAYHGLAERICIGMAVVALALMQASATSAPLEGDRPRLHLGRIERPSPRPAPEGPTARGGRSSLAPQMATEEASSDM